MKSYRALLIVTTLLGTILEAHAQFIPARLTSGVWDGITHTDGRQAMPAFDVGVGGWGLTYLTVQVPGTGPQELAGFVGVGGLNIAGGSPSDSFSISVYSSLTSIIANPTTGDLYNGHSSLTASVEEWGTVIGLPGLVDAYKVESLPVEGTGLVLNGGDTVFISVHGSHSGAWTWAETDISYPFGPDPVMFDFNAGTIEYMTNDPWNYPTGVAAVDIYFVESVPEPATMTVFVIGCVALLRRRLRGSR